MTEPHDPALDALFDLDGQVLVVDPKGGHWVRFIVTRVSVSADKPHGLDYSLTLHASDGTRLVGFDNAHPAGKPKQGSQSKEARKTTVIGYERSKPMNIRMPRPCSPISGM